MEHLLLPRQPALKPFRVLFVCESNAAWSLMAEAILKAAGGKVFHAMSAGFSPAKAVDPMTLEQLGSSRLPVEQCFTKPVQGFREDSLIPLDFVISTLDLHEAGYARGWPGNPTVIQWQIPDPMHYIGRDNGRRNQFRSVFISLQKRISLLLDLPPEKIAELADTHSAYLLASGMRR